MKIPRRSYLTPEQAEKGIDEVFKIQQKVATAGVPAADPPDAEPPNPAEDVVADVLLDKEKEALKRQRQDNRESKKLNRIRRLYTQKLHRLNWGWIIAVGVIVFLSGLKAPHFNDPNCSGSWCFAFALSEPVMIAFVTTTMATVISIFLIVAKWLFPPPGDQ
jgi:hypothetical protein